MQHDETSSSNIDAIARALVRPIVTVMFTMAFIFFTYMGLISGEVFAAISGTVIAFWFSSRSQEKQDATVAALQTAVLEKLPTAEATSSPSAVGPP
jgi:hypothetical protein